MANTYLPSQTYINLTLASLLEQESLSGLVTPFDGDRFRTTVDDTLIWRTKPVTVARDYEFRTRTRPIVFDEVYRNTLSITLDSHMTVGNKWTSEEKTLDMTSLRREIADPMAEAMVTRFNRKILTAIQNADWAVTDLNVDAAALETAYGPERAALAAATLIKTKLDRVGTPKQRYLVLGANAYMWFALSPAVTKYDPAQALSVFRQGILGTIQGFEIVDGTDIIGENDILAVHPSWAVLPTLAPDMPEEYGFGARGTVGGRFAARYVSKYDINYDTDRLLLSSFWTVAEIKDQYARHTAQTAANANDGSEKGDVIIEDGKTKFTGKNARGGKGTFTPKP